MSQMGTLIYLFNNPSQNDDVGLQYLNINVDMKKMNRSQSSYRQCKTLITEEDNDNLISKYASKNYASRNPNVASNSFIDTNKENNSLFQSVSERNFHSKPKEDISEFQIAKEDSKFWEEKCKRYEEQLKKMFRERETQYHSASNLNSSKSFNYTDQFYTNEIEELKAQLQKKERQLQFYKQEHSTRQEVESISSQISSKIEKDQKDKNLFVKEINSKQIEINNLQEKVKYHKSEISTLKIYLDEKDSVINELQEKLAQVDMKKKKIESYEFQLKEFNELLKDLEASTQRLKEETENKDSIISKKTNDILQLEQTIESYEDKLRAIEESLLRITHERKNYKERTEELQREISDWKGSYDELLRKSESIQDYELKLRAYMSMVEELTKSKTELFSSNEKYKIAYTTIEKSLAKYQDIERELNELKKELKERNDRIIELQDQQRNKKHLEEYNTKLRKEKDDLFLKNQEKIKECKALSLQIEELKSKNKLLQDEVQELNQNSMRVKERSQKLDTVMKKNTQLNQTILKKVDQIQKLEYKINNLENVLKNLQNQLSKQKIELETSEQEIRELTIQNNDIRERYETEVNNRIATEDKLVRSSQEINNLKFQVCKGEEEATAMRNSIEALQCKHDEEMEEVHINILNLQQVNKESEQLLQESNCRISELREEVEECNRGLEEAFKKEREHQASIVRCEQEIIQLKTENQRLCQELHLAKQTAAKIVELGQMITRSIR